jgi:phosphatidylserine/phosphatidylglycerophosphate/cardiolipin synthase-like enzyme
MKHSLKILGIILWLSLSLLNAQSRSVLIGDHYSQYVTQEVQGLSPQATIMLDQYVFTFDPLRKALAQKAADGAHVSLNMYRAHAFNPSTYYFFEDIMKQVSAEVQQRLQVNKYPGKYILHAKHLSWQQADRCACHIGSFNFTNLATAANRELMVVTYDDQAVYQECQEFHARVTQLCGQLHDQNAECLADAGCHVLENIPVRRTVITSLKHDLNASLITCIKNLGKGSVAFIGAFSMNDSAIVQALCDALERGAQINFFLDGTTIDTKVEKRLLAQLHAAGVRVFLYNFDGSKKFGKYACKMHAKFYAARHADATTLVIIGTQNLTKQYALNMASIHPQDPALFASVCRWCQELERECDAYATLNIEAVN